MTLTPLRAEMLAMDGVAHGFFGRQGGVSEGIYASLNCGPGSGDKREAVMENRKRAMLALAGAGNAKLLTLHQTHSTDVLTVSEAGETDERPCADGMVTDRPNLALGILTADCAPILFFDAEAHVIGAAHAGWKGALDGVTDTVIAAMMRLGAKPQRIIAAIGPCISQAAYEVGPEFVARFRDADANNTNFFVPSKRDGHWQFDLEAYITRRLARAGVGQIERLATCTYTREADFFSYRRATHCRQADYGRQLSAIMLSG